jgi:hypothetical protein
MVALNAVSGVSAAIGAACAIKAVKSATAPSRNMDFAPGWKGPFETVANMQTSENLLQVIFRTVAPLPPARQDRIGQINTKSGTLRSFRH